MQTMLPLRIKAEDLAALKRASKARSVSSVVEGKLKEYIKSRSITPTKREKLKVTRMSIDIEVAEAVKALSKELDTPVAKIVDAAVQEIISNTQTTNTQHSQTI